jgi:nucleolar GTP-binding protein
MLERVPTILSAQELLDKAFHAAAKIEIEDPDRYHRIRKELLGRIQSASDSVSSTLEKYVKAFPNMDHLRDYEAEVLDTMVGLQDLRRSISRVDWAREKSLDLSQEATMRMNRHRSIPAFHDELKRHYGRLSSVVKDVDDALAFLAHTRDTMRVLPEVRPDLATVVIAGFPNVGKTSLLRTWTSSRAEVAPYAFTTKHAEVGHLETPGRDALPRLVQVVDTPGLLDRPDKERNTVERQAVAALRHAADAVLFLIDPSGRSGYPVAEQEHLLAQVQKDMAGLPFLVAESKSDLAEGPPAPGRIRFSTATGEGLEALRDAVLALLPEEEELAVDPLDRWRGPQEIEEGWGIDPDGPAPPAPGRVDL